MKKLLKWLALGLGGFIVLLGIFIALVYLRVESQLNTVYADADLPGLHIPIPSDTASVARGKHLANWLGCKECHGENLGGRLFINDPTLGKIYAANITKGKGSAVLNYKDETWVRIIRHGVKPNGTSVLVMPTEDYFPLSDEDIGAIIAYMKTVPPIDQTWPQSEVALPVRLISTLLDPKIILDTARRVDHRTPRPPAPPRSVTAEYGKYVSNVCIGCHGEGFSGGPIPGAPPTWPPALNLTPAGNLKDWNLDQFKTVLRTGKTPIGHQISSEFMAWKAFRHMTDEEIEALWLYLKTLPAKPYGNR